MGLKLVLSPLFHWPVFLFPFLDREKGSDTVKSCYPDKQYTKVTEITIEELNALGVKGLILDIDNTLTVRDHPEVSPEVKQWLNFLKCHFIKLAVVSNNKRERVEPFARKLGIMYFSRSMKPLKKGLRQAQKMFHLDAAQIAVVGDQIYTDVLGAKRCGMKALLVQPIQLETGTFFRLKRKMERKYVTRFSVQKQEASAEKREEG